MWEDIKSLGASNLRKVRTSSKPREVFPSHMPEKPLTCLAILQLEVRSLNIQSNFIVYSTISY